MHETGMMATVIDLAVDRARLEGAQQIHRLTLRIGRLAGVEPEALSLAFEVLTAGTLAEGAVLEIETVEVVCYCSTCQSEFTPPSGFVYFCPACGVPSGEVRQGRELELTSMEVS